MTGIFKINNNEVFGSDGTFSGTIGSNATGFIGIKEADQYRITANMVGANADITSNWERVADSSFARIGSGIDQANGVFTFSQTGIYLILVNAEFKGLSGVDLYGGIKIKIDQGSGLTQRAEGLAGLAASNAFSVASCSYIFDVTNTTNDNVVFERVASDSVNVRLVGSTTKNTNSFTFIRLGDT